MTPPLIYAAHAAAWSLLGFLTGVVFMLRATRPATTTSPGGSAVAHEITTARTDRRRLWTRRILDSVVVLLVLASGVQAYTYYARTQQIVECQKAYQVGFADALDARTTATAAAQEALDELMTTVGTLTGGAPSQENRAKFTAALEQYLHKRGDAKRKQQENPYPSPRDLCK